MESTCIAVEPPVKCNTEMKPPTYSSCVLPKKDPNRKVLIIKLPLDIDIKIHHHHRAVFLLVALPWACLFTLLLYLMSSHQQQLQLYETELATLRIQSSHLSMQAFEIQNRLSQLDLALQKSKFKEEKVKETFRRKRHADDGKSFAIKAEKEVNRPSNDTSSDTSSDTMRGQIGPWFEDQQAVGDFGLRNCNLRDRGVKLIVNETGLYLIYAQVNAQVYYLATRSLNSYSINVFPGNKAASIPVAFCSANASVNDQGTSEVSCFTSIVRKLEAGDGISLQQLERQRRLVMRDGRTFIGLVRLG